MKKNFIYQSLYQVLIILIPLISTPYVSRILGPEGIGTYSYTYSVVSYFVLFAKMGIGIYGNRAVALVHDNKKLLSITFWNIYAVHGIFALTSLSIYIFCIIRTYENKLIMTIQGIYILSQLMDINWLYFGIEKFKLTVIRNTIIKVLSLVCIFVFVNDRGDTWIYILILALGSFLGESAIWMFIKNYVDFVIPKWRDMKVHIKPMVYLFLPSVAVSIYTMMDKILIEIFSETAQVGYYENSEKIVSIGRTLVVALGTVSLPHFTNLFSSAQDERAKEISQKSIQFMLWLSSALAFGMSGIAEELIPLYLGRGFEQSIYIVRGLVICVPLWAVADIIRNQYVLPRHKDSIHVVALLLAAVINVVSNLIFIPMYAAMGAVIGTIIAEAVVCIVLVIAARKVIPLSHYVKNGIGFAFLGIIMHLVVRVIGSQTSGGIQTLVLQIIIGAGIYLLGSFLYYYKGLKNNKIV